MPTPGGMLGRQQLSSMLGEVSRGDRAAFTRLYEATSPKLYAIVLRIVRRHQPGDKLSVTVQRGTDQKTLTVTLGDLPNA